MVEIFEWSQYSDSPDNSARRVYRVKKSNAKVLDITISNIYIYNSHSTPHSIFTIFTYQSHPASFTLGAI